jgi:hypothetical protein
MREGEQFLHQKDSELHTTAPVEHEQQRKKIVGEETSQKPAEKIADWLSIIEKTHTGHRENPEVMEKIKEHYHRENVIKPENIPDSYFENQKRLAREQGHGDIEITEEMKKQLSEVAVADQKSTLDNWIGYFTSKDVDVYPMWAKYWAFEGMLKLSTYNKEKHAFGKRTKETVAPFADLDREALAYTIDAVVKKANKQEIPEQADNPEFKKLLQGANFGKLYAFAIEQVTPTEESELKNTKGEWIKYNQNQDHMPLVESLQGYGTGWCTAGESTAKAQLQGGDFYVFYSSDKEGNPTIPRVAIRMAQDKIAEVRGIAPEQNLDPFINGVVEQKLSEFPDGKEYQKKSEDMKLLTLIDKKNQRKQELTPSELKFLYEIDASIEGFGYQKDPRIKELREQRNPKEDMYIIFECKKEQIATSPQEITKNTKAYVGKLEPGIFELVQIYNIENIYTSFPEGKIQRKEVEIGGKDAKSLEAELRQKGINIYDRAMDLLKSKDFNVLKNPEKIETVKLSIADLGFKNGATTDEIYKKAEELGLELCPAEVGPQLRLQYADQPMDDWVFIGMKQIAGRGGIQDVFYLGRDGGGLWLGTGWAEPDCRWGPGYQFVFRLRKSENLAT